MPLPIQKSYRFCNRIKFQVLLVILMVVRKLSLRHFLTATFRL